MSKRRLGVIHYKDIIIIVYLMAIALRSFTAPYANAGLISQVKYMVALGGAIIGYNYLKSIRQVRIFRFEFSAVNRLVLSFGIISLFLILLNRQFTSRTLLELFYLWLPAFYAYVLINTLNSEDIYRCMSISLMLFFAGYIINLGLTITGIISSISLISFRDSYSLLESSVYAAPSVTMAIFFLYYRKNKVYTIISVLFVLMTFKRLSVIFVIILFFLPMIIDVNRPVSKKVINLVKISFIVLALLYYLLMRPQTVNLVANRFGIDLYRFTMSRTYRFSLLYNNKNFVSTGFGSTYSFLMNNYRVSLEMDLLKIIFELSPIGLIIIVNQLFNTVKRNRYCFIVMMYLFFNLLFSHSLADMFGWLVLDLTFATIQYKNPINPSNKWRADEVQMKES